jgi:hypothetical protein
MTPFEYKLCGYRVNRTDTVKDLGIVLEIKLYFQHHVDYVFSQALKLLGFIRAITFFFLSIDSLFVLYCT